MPRDDQEGERIEALREEQINRRGPDEREMADAAWRRWNRKPARRRGDQAAREAH